MNENCESFTFPSLWFLRLAYVFSDLLLVNKDPSSSIGSILVASSLAVQRMQEKSIRSIYNQLDFVEVFSIQSARTTGSIKSVIVPGVLFTSHKTTAVVWVRTKEKILACER